MTGKIDFIIITYCASLNKDTVQISNSNGPYFRLSNPYYLKLPSLDNLRRRAISRILCGHIFVQWQLNATTKQYYFWQYLFYLTGIQILQDFVIFPFKDCQLVQNQRFLRNTVYLKLIFVYLGLLTKRKKMHIHDTRIKKIVRFVYKRSRCINRAATESRQNILTELNGS